VKVLSVLAFFFLPLYSSAIFSKEDFRFDFVTPNPSEAAPFDFSDLLLAELSIQSAFFSA